MRTTRMLLAVTCLGAGCARTTSSIAHDGGPQIDAPAGDAAAGTDGVGDGQTARDARPTDGGWGLIPSNTGPLDLPTGIVAVKPAAPTPIWVLNTDDGSIAAHDSAAADAGPGIAIRGAGPGLVDGVFFQLMSQFQAPDLAVFYVHRLDVPVNTRLIGVGNNALVLISKTEIVVGGTITVGANRLSGMRYPGPGGFAGSVNAIEAGGGPGGGGARPNQNDVQVGGGGGSFGGSGGHGGDSNGQPGAAAGATYGNADLVPLIGGSGGSGGEGGLGPGPGGHGGGALQLVAFERIWLTGGSTIDASGGGGAGTNSGAVGPDLSGGGGGGGAGGAIVLEAPVVSIDGVVGANGGAGGQGGIPQSEGVDGTDGAANITPARGSATVGISGGGGDGSDALGLAKSGFAEQYGGGGGGGGGRIRINTASGVEVYDRLLPTMASGLATVGKIRTP